MQSTTPGTIHEDVRGLSAGVTLQLRAGQYREPIVVSGVSGRKDSPIVIRGERASTSDGDSWPRSTSVLCTDETFQSYRRRANELARSQEASGDYPGVYYVADNGHLILRDCQWVVVEDLTFENCWPTAIYLENCQNIILRRLHIRGGTFAIGATGSDTRHLLVEECDWIQDTSCRGDLDLKAIRETGAMQDSGDLSECLLWRKTNWQRIHAERAETERFVDLEGDARAFDGDFFRAWTIAGYVILRNNCILDAFNGIHFYNQASGELQQRHSRNVLIEGNWFVRLRDNAVEPEGLATNWTVRHNYFVDCYATFSIEAPRSGFIYIYGNLGWNASQPGPGRPEDVRTTGRLFKLGTMHEALGPHYIMHNTWHLRGPVFKKKRIANLIHMNNVVGFNESAEEFSYQAASPFGSDWHSQYDPTGDWREIKAAEKRRFTKAWKDLSIVMDGDMIGHPLFPHELRAAGYPIGPSSVGDAPKFRSEAIGRPDGLKLEDPPAALPLRVLYPDGSKEDVPADDVGHGVAGAWQDDRLFSLSDPLFVKYWDDCAPSAST